MNAQEIFDTVARHLFAQGRAAVNPNTGYCFYRSPNGTKCAVGALISDDLYDPRMEDKSAVCVAEDFRSTLPEWFFENRYLLRSLQVVHDSYRHYQTFDENLKDRLKAIAENEGLNTEVLDGLAL